MEKGCSAASSNCQSAQDAQQEKKKKQTPQGPQPKSKSKPQSSTSQVRLEEATRRTVQEVTESMSKLREDVAADVDVDCVSSNSQHGGFAVVLDDESSTETGVLETFEISSSNSLPTTHSTGTGTGTGTAASAEVSTVRSVVDDSSSTDTLNGNENGGNSEDHSVSASSMNNVFFNDNDNDNEPPVVCLINDDDDFDEEEEEEDEDDDEEVQQQQQSMPIDCPNTSQIDGGIITTADGSKIFLETPVVEEPQSHAINHHPNAATVANVAPSDGMLTGKPKRLSDEFDAQDPEQEREATRGVKSESDVASTSLHDRQMSVRLKQMSLTANSNSTEAHSHSLSKADIESMDRIERRDFETEQRLTGGIVLGTSKLITKNRLNLSLINAGGAAAGGGGGASAGGGSASGSSSSDDWPSSSNGRAFSSDSKCTYKDLSTTPTSSRKYTNSRLSKSTAKLNLGTTLATTNTGGAGAACPQHNLLKSSVIVESTTTTTSTNTNSNDNLNASSSVKDNCTPVVTSFSSVGSQTNSQEGGCSRTSVVNCAAASQLDVDAQPSTSATSSTSGTSSARCHYAGATRQVSNASAQTQERFLARSGLAAGGAVNNNNRSRRRVEATRNGSKDVIVLEVVVEENANNVEHVEPGDFNADEPWGNCDGDEENNCSDLEEICTCQNSSGSLSDPLDMDANVNEETLALYGSQQQQQQQQQQQRKRKYNESRLLDVDYSLGLAGSGAGAAAAGGVGAVAAGDTGDNSRKRVAYDFASTPRSSSSAAGGMISLTPTGLGLGLGLGFSPGLGRRTPRALMPTRDNPPPELQHWLAQFQRWCHAERLLAVDRLIEHCDPSQVRHMMKVIEPQFQRDFISLLPRELALFVLSYLEPKDLLRAAQTCRSWRFLCDDNLLWKEKCRKAQILTESRSDRPKRGRDGNMPPIASPWKAAYMRQHIIEMNWRSRPVRKPKVLKGHDDHVITCLQFSGNRIVSGSDDNTLKVWSAVNGKCLRTLVGHTGGVWSSQMSGNIIISGSTDRTLKVWDMDSGSCVHTLQGHTSTVRCMHLHGNK
ncbi:hypothetical protein ACLKA7_017401 [Drosophila subpalustris]